MHYEMFMRAALGEAALAAGAGERADGAVAVLDEAMVAHGRESVRGSGDPTAHAVIVCLREAARRLGRTELNGLTVFAAVEPCAMCAAALRLADADEIVYALADPVEGACGSIAGGGDEDRSGRRLRIVSGILADEAGELWRAESGSRSSVMGGPPA
jgi:tRNA(adenine34) deaminase